MAKVIKYKGTESISRDLIFDNELSDRARFVYCYMMAKPDDWDFYVGTTAKDLGYSEDTLHKYINELIARGWLEKVEQVRDANNKWGAVSYKIYEVRREKKAVTENFRDGKISPQTNIDFKDNIDFKEKENSPKESDFGEIIVKFWNDHADKIYPRVKKVTDRTKKAIKARIKAGYTLDDIKKAILLMNSLRNFYKGLDGSGWKADFHWLIENVNGNFDKILEGSLHTQPIQQSQYNEIMHNNMGDRHNKYSPATGGYINFRTSVGMYWTHINPEFGQIIDGYKDNDRPDGAELGSPFGIFKWSSTENRWKYDRKF